MLETPLIQDTGREWLHVVGINGEVGDGLAIAGAFLGRCRTGTVD